MRRIYVLGCLCALIYAPITGFTKEEDTNWQSAPFWCLQSELSPGTLIYSKERDLRLFMQPTNSPVGPPSHVAFANQVGLVISTNGPAIDCTTMSECWAVVWFAGGRGWTNWDVPWLIVFQHKPLRARLDSTGLRLRFPHGAEHVAMMPLFGYEKIPQNDLAEYRFHSGRKLETAKWDAGLPREVVQRARYWSSALREFPIHCADQFSVDRSQDSVTIRQNMEWFPISDDWNTPHLPLHPISPPLGQASLDKSFPVSFSSHPFDLDFFTPYGPLLAVEKETSLDATLPLLRYINEMEIAELPPANAPSVVIAALKKLRDTAAQKFHDPNKYDYDFGGFDGFCRAIAGDAWYAKALPYYDEPTRTIALSSLRKYFHEDVLVTNRFKLREYPKGSGHSYYMLADTGIRHGEALDDAGKFSANLLETLWAYAQYTGDWELIKDRWNLVKKLFVTPAETRWVGFGRDGIAEMGDEAAPCLAMARMAYAVGDQETYNYAACMFVRELTHLQLKERGASYFREHQPWQSLETMGAEVYLTNLRGDPAGWQIDGPAYPKNAVERRFNDRWLRFKNEDVGRFYRDYWHADVRKELDLLQTRWDSQRRWQNESDKMPSLVQLRSLLLNETPDQLAKIALPEQFTRPASGIIASCISILRTSHPIHYQRLIPKANPSPFVTGLERDSFGPSVVLTQAILTRMKDSAGIEHNQWPEPGWRSWNAPSKIQWSFGQIVPGKPEAVSQPETIRLNWNTQVTLYR